MIHTQIVKNYYDLAGSDPADKGLIVGHLGAYLGCLQGGTQSVELRGNERSGALAAQPEAGAADAQLNTLRLDLRLARQWDWLGSGIGWAVGLAGQWDWLGSGQYEHASRIVAGIGRLLGGWIRQTASGRSGSGAARGDRAGDESDRRLRRRCRAARCNRRAASCAGSGRVRRACWPGRTRASLCARRGQCPAVALPCGLRADQTGLALFFFLRLGRQSRCRGSAGISGTRAAW